MLLKNKIKIIFCLFLIFNLNESNEQCECECKPELDIVKPDKVEGPLTQDFQEWLSQ